MKKGNIYSVNSQEDHIVSVVKGTSSVEVEENHLGVCSLKF